MSFSEHCNIVILFFTILGVKHYVKNIKLEIGVYVLTLTLLRTFTVRTRSSCSHKQPADSSECPNIFFTI